RFLLGRRLLLALGLRGQVLLQRVEGVVPAGVHVDGLRRRELAMHDAHFDTAGSIDKLHRHHRDEFGHTPGGVGGPGETNPALALDFEEAPASISRGAVAGLEPRAPRAAGTRVHLTALNGPGCGPEPTAKTLGIGPGLEQKCTGRPKAPAHRD